MITENNSLGRRGLYPDTSRTEPQQRSVIWKGFKVVLNFFYSTPISLIGIAVAAVTCHIFYPILAPTFYVLAASAVLSKLILKIIQPFNFSWVENTERLICEYLEKNNKIKIICFLVNLAVGWLFPIAGGVLAFPLGIINGVVMEVDHCRTQQEIEYDEMINYRGPEVQTLVVE